MTGGVKRREVGTNARLDLLANIPSKLIARHYKNIISLTSKRLNHHSPRVRFLSASAIEPA
jgi:hypothetical protein